MNDIVSRLRESVRACRALDRSALLEEAATVIERLRLTHAEREAITDAASAYEFDADDNECARIAATLHGLLERL